MGYTLYIETFEPGDRERLHAAIKADGDADEPQGLTRPPEGTRLPLGRGRSAIFTGGAWVGSKKRKRRKPPITPGNIL